MAEENKYPNPVSMSQEDYVKRRFSELPKEVSEYLDLSTNDARAHLEVLFRAEYYRYRNGETDKVLHELYQHYMAAKTVICAIQKSKKGTVIDDDFVLRFWKHALEQMKPVDELPMDFGWTCKDGTETEENG